MNIFSSINQSVEANVMEENRLEIWIANMMTGRYLHLKRVQCTWIVFVCWSCACIKCAIPVRQRCENSTFILFSVEISFFGGRSVWVEWILKSACWTCFIGFDWIFLPRTALHQFFVHPSIRFVRFSTSKICRTIQSDEEKIHASDTSKSIHELWMENIRRKIFFSIESFWSWKIHLSCGSCDGVKIHRTEKKIWRISSSVFLLFSSDYRIEYSDTNRWNTSWFANIRSKSIRHVCFIRTATENKSFD